MCTFVHTKTKDIMKTITITQFNASIERGKNVVVKPFTPYVSKPTPIRKLNVDALKASLERGKKSC